LNFVNKFCILKSTKKPEELFVSKYPHIIISLASLTLRIVFFITVYEAAMQTWPPHVGRFSYTRITF